MNNNVKKYTDKYWQKIYYNLYNYGLKKLDKKEEAEDFACWGLIINMNNRTTTLKSFLLIDYLREHYVGKVKIKEIFEAKKRLCFPLEFNENEHTQFILNFGDNERYHRKIKEYLKYLKPLEQTIVKLYCEDELTYKEIGEIFNVSESRICQKFRLIKRKIKNAPEIYK